MSTKLRNDSNSLKFLLVMQCHYLCAEVDFVSIKLGAVFDLCSPASVCHVHVVCLSHAEGVHLPIFSQVSKTHALCIDRCAHCTMQDLYIMHWCTVAVGRAFICKIGKTCLWNPGKGQKCFPLRINHFSPPNF